MDLISYTKQFSSIGLSLLKKSKSLETEPKLTYKELFLNGLITIVSISDFLTSTGIRKFKITYKVKDRIKTKTVIARNKVDAVHKFRRFLDNTELLSVD